MTAKVSKDNVSGEIRVPVKAGPQSGRNLIDLDQEASNQLVMNQIERDLEDAYNTLPANQENHPSINFLGSSYSGVDIKVVAHLYDTANWRDDEIKKMEDEKKVTDEVVDGCVSLQTAGFSFFADDAANDVLTFDERRRLFIQKTGLSESENQKSLNIILSAVFRTGNFSFLGVARMRRDNDSLTRAMALRSKELKEKLEHLRSIQEESSTTIELGTLQTISVQSHREKYAVRALGHSYARGYTRGTRTIAGSMIFTIFNEHALLKLIRAMGRSQTYGEKDMELSTLLPDQLPPIDITIAFANEYGALSDFRLYGVEFVNDGATYSIEDLLSEQIINFVCRDADIMTSRGKVRLSRLQKGMFNETPDKDVAGSSLLFNNNAYDEYVNKLRVRRSLKSR